VDPEPRGGPGPGPGRGRVGEQGVLDLGGSDVLAAADDGVVGAALDEQVAVGIEPATVPGLIAGGRSGAIVLTSSVGVMKAMPT
jgi:hypothetical protein